MTKDYLWALLTLIIAVALAFALLSVAQDDNSKGEASPPLQHSTYDRKLNRLDRQGVEAAYRSRVALAVSELDDRHQRGEPGSARLRGHRNARKIYIEVMSGIDARDPPTEEELK